MLVGVSFGLTTLIIAYYPATMSGGFSIKAELQKMSNSERVVAQNRLTELEIELSTTGHELRDDSQMAYKFATAQLDVTAHEAAGEMAAAQFIHSHTCYGERCQNELRVYANAMHAAFPHIPWSKIWEIVRRYMVPVIKLDALLESGYGDGIPADYVVTGAVLTAAAVSVVVDNSSVSMDLSGDNEDSKER